MAWFEIIQPSWFVVARGDVMLHYNEPLLHVDSLAPTQRELHCASSHKFLIKFLIFDGKCCICTCPLSNFGAAIGS